MTKDEIMNTAQYLNVRDIMKIFDCGRDTAYKKLREIKSVSDTMRISGKITVRDYEAWYNRPLAQKGESHVHIDG